MYLRSTQRGKLHHKIARPFKGPYVCLSLLRNNNLELVPVDGGRKIHAHIDNCKLAQLRPSHLTLSPLPRLHNSPENNTDHFKYSSFSPAEILDDTTSSPTERTEPNADNDIPAQPGTPPDPPLDPDPPFDPNEPEEETDPADNAADNVSSGETDDIPPSRPASPSHSASAATDTDADARATGARPKQPRLPNVLKLKPGRPKAKELTAAEKIRKKKMEAAADDQPHLLTRAKKKKTGRELLPFQYGALPFEEEANDLLDRLKGMVSPSKNAPKERKEKD